MEKKTGRYGPLFPPAQQINLKSGRLLEQGPMLNEANAG